MKAKSKQVKAQAKYFFLDKDRINATQLLAV